MNVHKNTRVTPYARQETGQLHQTGQCRKTALAERFNVSRPTIHNLIDKWNWCALLTSIMPLNRIKD